MGPRALQAAGLVVARARCTATVGSRGSATTESGNPYDQLIAERADAPPSPAWPGVPARHLYHLSSVMHSCVVDFSFFLFASTYVVRKFPK